jgi:hypothetical protein
MRTRDGKPGAAGSVRPTSWDRSTVSVSSTCAFVFLPLAARERVRTQRALPRRLSARTWPSHRPRRHRCPRRHHRHRRVWLPRRGTKRKRTKRKDGTATARGLLASGPRSKRGGGTAPTAGRGEERRQRDGREERDAWQLPRAGGVRAAADLPSRQDGSTSPILIPHANHENAD